MEPSPQGVQAMIDSLNFGADAETAIRVYLKNAWRPIETAPKNGKQFLGYMAESFSDDPYDDYSVGPFYYVCWWNSDDRWFETDECGALELSHWMPLPEPPSKGE